MTTETNYEAMDSQLQITVRGVDLAEPEMLLAALERIITFHQPRHAHVFINERSAEGRIEYVTTTTFAGGGGLTVGILQRSPGAAIERHS